MKAIEKKILTGAIAASFLLGGAGLLTHANAEDTAAAGTAAKTKVEKPAQGDRGFGGHGKGREMGGMRGGNLVQETATVLGVEESVVKEALTQGKTLAQFAQDQGLSEDVYLQKLAEAQTKTITDAVAAGKLTQDQADKIQTGLADRLKKEIEQTGFGKRPGKGGFEGPGKEHGGKIVEETATILGVDPSVVKDALKGGKTLVQIAEAQGISEDVLLQKLTDAENQAIADAVTAGKLTQEQADKQKSGLADRLKKQVENAMPNGFKGGKGGFGPGFNKEILTQALGITQEELTAGEKAGKSLAEIAQEKGISEEQLIAKLKDGLTDPLKQFVESKRQPHN